MNSQVNKNGVEEIIIVSKKTVHSVGVAGGFTTQSDARRIVIVETFPHREGSQKDDVAVGVRCNVLLQKATLAFCGGGRVVTTRVPSPK